MPFDKNFKLFKTHERATAGIKLMEDYVSIFGPDTSSFVSVSKGGVSIGGKMSFQSLPNQIKIGGLFSFNFLPFLLIPSTIATPFPVLKPSIPIPKETIKTLVQVTSALTALLV